MWALGGAFLVWPYLSLAGMFRLIRKRRTSTAKDISIAMGSIAFLSLVSLTIAALNEPFTSRFLASMINMTVWMALAFYATTTAWPISRETWMLVWVRIAAVQGLVVVTAVTLSGGRAVINLPLSYLLPSHLSDDPALSGFTHLNLAFSDYFGAPVTRTSGFFANPTWCAAAGAIGVIFATNLALDRTIAWKSAFAYGICTLPAMYYAYSRATYAALIAALLFGCLVIVKRRFGNRGLISVVTLGMFVAIALASVFNVPQIISSINTERSGSLAARTSIYDLTISAILNSPFPVLGHGVKERRPGLAASLGTHDTYLGLAYRVGILAAAIFIVWLLVVFVRRFRALDVVGVAILGFLTVWMLTEDVDAGSLIAIAFTLVFDHRSLEST